MLTHEHHRDAEECFDAAIGDLDGDSRLDVVTVANIKPYMEVAFNRGNACGHFD